MSDSDARDNYTDSSSCDSILRTSHLDNPSRSSVLRPSLFTSSLSNNGNSALDNKLTFSENNVLANSRFNPFLKDDNEETNKTDEVKKENNVENNKDNKDLKEDPLALLSQNGLQQRSNFLVASKNSIPRVEQTGFVFGQNVHERVTGAIETTSKQNNESNNKQLEQDDNTTSSGASGLLFSNAIQNKKSDDVLVPKENVNKSLTEVAREYEESRAQKRKYEEVETFTGEENESNIVDINCKLFAFINRNWEERGRGSLRLNDSKDKNGCSRVVFRTSGNLRLLVNTKVWGGMVAERSSQKSLRLTAMDNNGQIKVFLIMSRPDDINNLYKNLTVRINDCKTTEDISSSNSENELKNGEENKLNETKDKINDNEVEKETNKYENLTNEEVNNSSDNKENNADEEGNYEPSPKKSTVEEN